MKIETQFNLIAEDYDRNRRKFIPCFDDFYQTATEFILSNRAAPKRVLDLGAGTGLLTSFWYQHCPSAEYILVDIADDMLEIARKRFAGIETIRCRSENYIHTLPDTPFDTVISALSIHHLEEEEKRALFSKLFRRLPCGGLLVNYDQFCAGQPALDRWFDAHWVRHLENSGLSAQDLARWEERRKLDRECSAEQQMAMLRACGFAAVSCVYSCQKFSVIAALKQ